MNLKLAGSAPPSRTHCLSLPHIRVLCLATVDAGRLRLEQPASRAEGAMGGALPKPHQAPTAQPPEDRAFNGDRRARQESAGTTCSSSRSAIGLAWQVLNVAVAAGSIATAIQGCATSDGSAGSVAGCVFGIAGTVLSVGSAFKAANAAGWFARANSGFGNSGLENIALDVFSKRSQDLHQERHDDLMRRVLGDFSTEPVEFLGYAPETHRLARRSEGTAAMDIVSREHLNSTRFTVSYAMPDTRIGKRQSFQHETLSSDLFEARFDGSAEGADPNADFDAASGYQTVENTISCFAAGTWQGGQVLSAQMYDNSAEETFAFASMGIFTDDSADGVLQAFTPQGLPLPILSCSSSSPDFGRSLP
ncbi:hypothetical protein B0H14DRAFT_2579348 [Mycena olivaceomarginata]|nr:hypothetical protein B0H14DRAFT_2579348 [Mycena olivaceomarginata]